MTITDLPFFSTLKGKLRWHEQRQSVLAENVANADTPGFQGRDLAAFKPEDTASPRKPTMAVSRTDGRHLVGFAATGGGPALAGADRKAEVTPRGNAVVLEDEMMKVAGNQMDFQAASTLYERGMRLLRTAVK